MARTREEISAALKAKRVQNNLKYLAEVDERRRTKHLTHSLKNYGNDNEGYYHRRGGLQRFRNLPPHMRPVAERELARLMAKAKSEGKQITQQKYGSLCANAAYIARYVRCSNLLIKWHRRYFQTKMYVDRWRARSPEYESKYSHGPRTNNPESCLTGI